MSAGTYPQLAGAAFEVGGLVTVARGIGETRQTFTDRPSLARRARARLARAAGRLRRRRSTTVHVGTAGAIAVAGGSVRARGRVGFGPWDDEALEERIERLRRAFESHERVLNELDERLDGEESARREADQRHEQRVEEVHRELADFIRAAAAGGLRLETVGVVLFALGVVLGTWGNLVA